MASVAGVSILLGLCTAGVDTLFPLWVTQDLQLAAGDWANLRSLRMAGVLVGVIVLGALSERFGSKLLGMLSLIGLAATLSIMAIAPGRSIWLSMPIFGALASTVFVNLNALTQLISQRRQGLANTIYRAIGAVAGIIAPVGVTMLAFAWGSNTRVFLLLAGFLAIGAILLGLYPHEPVDRRLGSVREELSRLLSVYALALRNRTLMWMIHLTGLWFAITGGVLAFAAIRFTLELHQTDRWWGALSSISGALAFVLMIGLIRLLDRVRMARVHLTLGIIGSCGAIAMGSSDSLLVSAIGFLVFIPAVGALIAPNSMWTSRLAGTRAQTSGFSMQKVVTAFYYAGVLWVLGLLEPVAGIRNVILGIGVVSLVLAISFAWLPEHVKSVEEGERG